MSGCDADPASTSSSDAAAQALLSTLALPACITMITGARFELLPPAPQMSMRAAPTLAKKSDAGTTPHRPAPPHPAPPERAKGTTTDTPAGLSKWRGAHGWELASLAATPRRRLLAAAAASATVAPNARGQMHVDGRRATKHRVVALRESAPAWWQPMPPTHAKAADAFDGRAATQSGRLSRTAAAVATQPDCPLKRQAWQTSLAEMQRCRYYTREPARIDVSRDRGRSGETSRPWRRHAGGRQCSACSGSGGCSGGGACPVCGCLLYTSPSPRDS